MAKCKSSYLLAKKTFLTATAPSIHHFFSFQSSVKCSLSALMLIPQFSSSRSNLIVMKLWVWELKTAKTIPFGTYFLLCILKLLLYKKGNLSDFLYSKSLDIQPFPWTRRSGKNKQGTSFWDNVEQTSIYFEVHVFTTSGGSAIDKTGPSRISV